MADNRELFGLCEVPGEAAFQSDWQMMRAKADHPQLFVCVSSVHLGCYTHFYKRQTIPHRNVGCKPCKAGFERRWKGYVLGVAIKNGAHVIVEISPPSAMQLIQYRTEYGTLRGLNLILSRTSDRPNAKISITHKGMYHAPQKLPPEQDIWPIIARIWGVDAETGEIVQRDRPHTEGQDDIPAQVVVPGIIGDDDEWIQQRVAEAARGLALPSADLGNGNGAAHRRKRL